MLGFATIAVVMVGALVVSDHLRGRLQLEDSLSAGVVSETSVR